MRNGMDECTFPVMIAGPEMTNRIKTAEQGKNARSSDETEEQ
jgi:hypothetical protein